MYKKIIIFFIINCLILTGNFNYNTSTYAKTSENNQILIHDKFDYIPKEIKKQIKELFNNKKQSYTIVIVSYDKNINNKKECINKIKKQFFIKNDILAIFFTPYDTYVCPNKYLEQEITERMCENYENQLNKARRENNLNVELIKICKEIQNVLGDFNTNIMFVKIKKYFSQFLLLFNSRLDIGRGYKRMNRIIEENNPVTKYLK